MNTHHFLTDDDIFNGYFSDDYGRKRYSYHYDPDSKVLTVTCGPFGRRQNLSDKGVDRLSNEKLRDRLIELANEIGEDLIANPPIKS